MGQRMTVRPVAEAFVYDNVGKIDLGLKASFEKDGCDQSTGLSQSFAHFCLHLEKS